MFILALLHWLHYLEPHQLGINVEKHIKTLMRKTVDLTKLDQNLKAPALEEN